MDSHRLEAVVDRIQRPGQFRKFRRARGHPAPVFEDPTRFAPPHLCPRPGRFPNSTGKGPAAGAHCPPRARSNNRSSPLMEFQVGAIARINCVQSSGTPSAYALTPISINKQIANLRIIDITISQTGCAFSCSRLFLLQRCLREGISYRRAKAHQPPTSSLSQQGRRHPCLCGRLLSRSTVEQSRLRGHE